VFATAERWHLSVHGHVAEICRRAVGELRLALDGALSRDLSRAEGAVRAVGVTLDGCGLDDISMPLPAQASPRAVLEALASTCSP